MRRPILFLLLLLAVNSQFAQNLIVYYESQAGQNQTDTLYVYFYNMTSQPLDVTSTTLSFCYTSGAQLQPTAISSEFASAWGTSYELCLAEAEFSSYEGTLFSQRAKYGITTLNPQGITIPTGQTGLGQLMLKIPFSVSGSAYGQYYVEITSQNQVNEIGDQQGDPISFVSWNAAFPFPVEWLSFRAEPTEEGFVALNWQTASEQNSNFFEVEKSFDGEIFQSLERIDAQGNSQEMHSYSYLDKGYMKAEMFYRIKQVDINGAFTHSDVLQLNFSDVQGKKYRISPIPFNDFVSVESLASLEQDAQLILTDLTGRVILKKSWKAGQNKFTIPTAQLNAGVYIVQIVDSFGNVESTPIVKK